MLPTIMQPSDPTALQRAIKFLGHLSVAHVALLALSCAPTVPAQHVATTAVPEQPTASPLPVASTSAPSGPMFSPTTFQELHAVATADRLLAVVRCNDATITAPGSRSERHDFRTTALHISALASAGLMIHHELQLTHFAQGATAMKRGQLYLIAAYREAANSPLNLVQAIAVDAASADAALKNGEREAAKHW
ncbi:MAG: hypothetical protein KBG15_11020 [Kofleriaceae bacterium]|nr:hypothetical protein [Kofleriaceae bacterium]